jgi:hypothetical protein
MPVFHMAVKEGNGTILGCFINAFVIMHTDLLSPARVNGIPFDQLSGSVKMAAKLFLDSVCVRARVLRAADEFTGDSPPNLLVVHNSRLGDDTIGGQSHNSRLDLVFSACSSKLGQPATAPQ